MLQTRTIWRCGYRFHTLPTTTHSALICEYHQTPFRRSTSSIEEQTLPYYNNHQYYPVRIGDRIKDRYRIITKLGYGSYSTVWLARDESNNEFKSLKICVQGANGGHLENEVKMLQRLTRRAEGSNHPGIEYTRTASDIFHIKGSAGSHLCFATRPQGSSLRTFQEILPNAMLPVHIVKKLILRLLLSLDWIHKDCGVIHTDISPQNVLTHPENQGRFQALEDLESDDPSIPVETKEGPIYRCRHALAEITSKSILTDYGQMRLIDSNNHDWYMPDIYRAPEILLGLPWSHQVDVWSVGLMTLELLEGKNLFDPVDKDDDYVLPLALAQYIGYMGLPPKHMLEKSPNSGKYFDSKGDWNAQPPIPDVSLEKFVTSVRNGEDKDRLLRFVRRMLNWDPDRRASKKDLMEDEWLKS